MLSKRSRNRINHAKKTRSRQIIKAEEKVAASQQIEHSLMAAIGQTKAMKPVNQKQLRSFESQLDAARKRTNAKRAALARLQQE